MSLALTVPSDGTCLYFITLLKVLSHLAAGHVCLFYSVDGKCGKCKAFLYVIDLCNYKLMSIWMLLAISNLIKSYDFRNIKVSSSVSSNMQFCFSTNPRSVGNEITLLRVARSKVKR